MHRIDQLINQLQDDCPQSRQQAVESLRALNYSSAVAPLVTEMSDAVEQVRGAAIRRKLVHLLRRTREEEAINVMIDQLIADPSYRVRGKTTFVLGKTEKRLFSPWLKRCKIHRQMSRSMPCMPWRIWEKERSRYCN
ncbi:TPA: hypothetical protein EYG59_25895 [Candidatus Poribacteria bacterium]|nr:hypothetical protein [Candidatus Poribacteria bacterium]